MTLLLLCNDESVGTVCFTSGGSGGSGRARSDPTHQHNQNHSHHQSHSAASQNQAGGQPRGGAGGGGHYTNADGSSGHFTNASSGSAAGSGAGSATMECDSPSASQSMRLVPSSGQGAPRMGWSDERHSAHVQHVPTHHPHPQQIGRQLSNPIHPGGPVMLNPNQGTTLVALPTQTLNLQAAAQTIAPQQVLITDSPGLQTLLVQPSTTQHPGGGDAPVQNPSRQSQNSSVSSSTMTIDLTNLQHQAAVLNAAGLHPGVVDPAQLHAVDATQVGSVNMQLGFPAPQPQTTVTAHPGGTQYTALPQQTAFISANPTTSFPFTIAGTTAVGGGTNLASSETSTSHGRAASERSSEESPMTGIVLTQQSPTVASH